MGGVGIAVRRKFQRGLEACGYECTELVKEQAQESNLDAETAADLVYVRADEADFASVVKIVQIFEMGEKNGVPIDGLISGARHFGVLPGADDAESTGGPK